MEQQEHHTVRNDALRLTLSRQEGEYIHEQLAAARKSLKTLAIVAITGGILLAIIWLLTDSDYYSRLKLSSAELHSFLRNAGLLVGAGAGLVTFVAILKLPFAWMKLTKYKNYRSEHGLFLDRCNRPRQSSSPHR